MSLNDPRRLQVPTPPAGVEIASFATYLEAQKAVDALADSAFAVRAVTIVGSDLRMVERVTGRLNYPRVAIAGAASGGWFGVFVGLLLSMFSQNPALVTIVVCAGIGAAFGMLFGVISYALTGGKRDFTSSSQVVASRYSVLCLPELADEARQRLRQAGVPLVSASDAGPVGSAAVYPGQQQSQQGWPGAPGQYGQPGRYGTPSAPGAQGAPGAPGAPVADQDVSRSGAANGPGAAGAPERPRAVPPVATEPPRYGQRIENPDERPTPES